MGRGYFATFATAVLVIALSLAACASPTTPAGGTATKGAEPTGAGSGAANPAATDVILKAAETMFTWVPRTDNSPVDAFKRALPFMAGELKTRAETVTARGNSVWWQEWKVQRAEVTAVAKLVPAEHPKDSSDEVERSIVMSQVIKGSDGRVLDESTFKIDRVVAKKGKDGWRVVAIDFFPENQWFTPTCPPGYMRDAQGGQCEAVKLCPGGTWLPQSAQCVTTTTTQSPTTTRTVTTTSPTVTSTSTPTTTSSDVQTTDATTTTVTTTEEVTTTAVTTTEVVTTAVTTTEAPAPPEEPPPPTMCPDGSVAAAGQTCPSIIIEAPPAPDETFKPPA